MVKKGPLGVRGMRGVVLASLLLGLMLSGCTSEDPPVNEADDASSTSSASTTSGSRTSASTSGTGSTASKANQAPTANLTADVRNGTAPLNVTFTLVGGDADGGALTWTLAAANATGNATVLGNGTFTRSGSAYAPVNVTHAFTEAGNHSVVLTVRDATHNATATVAIAVDAGAPAASGEVVQTLECWVLQGLPAPVRLGGNGGNPGVGGCLTQVLAQDGLLVAMSFGAECFTDPPIAVGDAAEEGAQFNIYCDVSVSDTDVTMDFAAA